MNRQGLKGGHAPPTVVGLAKVGLAVYLLMACSGCTSNVGELSIRLLFPADNPDLLERRADFLRVRVDGPEGRYGPKEFALSDGRAVLSDVPVGDDQEITIDGLQERGGATRLRARSGPVSIVSGINVLELLMGRVEQFNLLPVVSGRSGMKQGRAFHTATALEDGTILFAGGTTMDWRPIPENQWPIALNSVERIESRALRFDATIDCSGFRCLNTPRIGHTATRMPSGSVLIFGGSRGGSGVAPNNDIEIYSPESRKLLKEESQGTDRANHRAILRDDGVLLVSGAARSGRAQALLTSVEHYAQGQVETKAELQLLPPRRDFTLTALADGTLFVSGGFDNGGHPLASTKLLRPRSESWIDGPPLNIARAHHSATRLADGSVLIAGGLQNDGNATNSLERYFPEENKLVRLTAELRHDRWSHTATLIDDGRVIVVGGFRSNANGAPTDSVEAVQIAEDTVLVPLSTLNLALARAGHSATLLPSGLLLVAGGFTGTEATASAEVFIY